MLPVAGRLSLAAVLVASRLEDWHRNLTNMHIERYLHLWMGFSQKVDVLILSCLSPVTPVVDGHLACLPVVLKRIDIQDL